MRPHPISSERAARSPFRTVEKVKEYLKKYKDGLAVGFTYTSSLKSMGLIPRADGTYRLGRKYI